MRLLAIFFCFFWLNGFGQSDDTTSTTISSDCSEIEILSGRSNLKACYKYLGIGSIPNDTNKKSIEDLSDNDLEKMKDLARLFGCCLIFVDFEYSGRLIDPNGNEIQNAALYFYAIMPCSEYEPR